jgi:putative membrane protein
MTKLLVHWVLSALCLLLVARVLPGFKVRGFGTALFAAVVIGFVNGTLGLLLKVLTIPLSVVTLGLFLLVINALMLELSAWFVPGFEVAGFGTAFLASLILTVLSVVVRELLSK